MKVVMVIDNLERASAEDLLNHQFTKIYEDEEGTQSFNIHFFIRCILNVGYFY